MTDGLNERRLDMIGRLLCTAGWPICFSARLDRFVGKSGQFFACSCIFMVFGMFAGGGSTGKNIVMTRTRREGRGGIVAVSIAHVCT